MVVTVSLTTADLRNVVLNNAKHEATRLSMAIAAQTSRSVQSVDLVLQDLRDSVSEAGITTEAAFRTRLATQEAQGSLMARLSNLPQTDAISIIDSSGKLVNFTRSWPIPEIDVSDRDYFIHFSSNPDAGLFVSYPVQNRGNGTWTVYLARRVSGPGGTFLGLVLGAIKLQYFADFYRALVGGETGMTVALRRRDGVLLSRYPAVGGLGAKPPLSADWYQIVAQRAGPNPSEEYALEGSRIVAVQPLSDYPLVVSVSLSNALVLGDWRRFAATMALGTLCAVLCFGLLLRAIILQLRRLERSENSLRYFAHHDDLTKLANRFVFQQRLEEALALARRSGRGLAVLCLDLDRFKSVNDTRGHAVGDKLLTEVSARMRAAVRELDTVARTGGDEFAIIQTLVDQPSGAEALANRLTTAINKPYDIDGQRCVIGVSIGIALFPQNGKTVSDLQRNADTALYRAKADGRRRHRFFEPGMDLRQQDKFVLEQELRDALESGQLELAYQPIVDARTRQVRAVEALLRWRHPERGLIAPAEFIEIAETSGLIIQIGYWVLETACAEVSAWPDGVQLSVNLSPMQVREGDLVSRISDILTRTGLAPERLALEVTEGLLLEGTENAHFTMTALCELGVRFSLDDFGTAHAGLSYLRAFPFDTIKIDRSFVQEACTRREARAIIEAILVMSRGLGLRALAEGVETEEQLALMRELGCQLVQGYLTGKAVPAAEARLMHQRSLAQLRTA